VEPDPLLCNIIAGLLIALFLLPFSGDFVPMTAFELFIILINGMIVLGIGFVMLTIGPSLISAPEVSLFSLIETVLGPVWVWIGGYEAPPLTAVYGGLLLISALAGHR
jgi:drug/metabolite transporter (DMT)-like permease